MSMRIKIATLMMALAVVMAFSVPAFAELGAIGPVDAATGYPIWVQDKAGLRLGLCPGGDPNCLAVAPVTPFEQIIGFGGGEGFWWAADTAVGGPPPAPEASLVLAVEAAFGTADGSAVDGFQWAFNRIRVRGSGLPLNTACTIVHPFSSAGGDILTTDAAGTLNFTTDYGCVDGIPALPCETRLPPLGYSIMATPIPPSVGDPWGNALSIFLTAVAPPAPVGYIGNPNVPQTVTGSPTGNNVFTVTCPPLAPLTTTQFLVQGKLFDTLAVATAIAKGDFDGDGQQDIAAIGNNAQVGDVNSAWFSTTLSTWIRLTPPVGATVAKVISGNFNNARLGDEIAIVTTAGTVFVYNDMLTATALPTAPLGTLVKDIVAGDFNVARLGEEIAGISTANRVLVSTTMVNLTQTATGSLAQIKSFNFDNVGTTDIIGLSAAGKIWFSTDLGAIWVNAPGTLASMTIGDFNNDGLDDLAGLSAAGKIWFTTDLATWTNTTGTLGEITAGDFNAARLGDEFGGINAATRKIWIANTPVAAPGNSGWVTLAGTADELMYLGRLGSEISILNALSGKIWTSPNGITWTIRNP